MKESVISLYKMIDNPNLNEQEKIAIIDGLYALNENIDKIRDPRKSILELSKLYLPQFDKEQKGYITEAIHKLVDLLDNTK